MVRLRTAILDTDKASRDTSSAWERLTQMPSMAICGAMQSCRCGGMRIRDISAREREASAAVCFMLRYRPCGAAVITEHGGRITQMLQEIWLVARFPTCTIPKRTGDLSLFSAML